MRIVTDEHDLTLEPMFDDAELDARASTGIVYWEGAVRAWKTDQYSTRHDDGVEPVAHGFMELTGYANDVRF